MTHKSNGNSSSYYIKILLKYTIQKYVFYEESIFQVYATSFDTAYQKVESYVRLMREPERKNMYGNTVHCSIVDYLDCFQSDDMENDVQEVYSRIFQNHFEFSEQELVKLLGDTCTRKEMLPLRYFPDQKEI